ncbi:MAG: hypothetical protein ACRECX_01680 [Methyloceanibacter sp.]|uniref:hypothetical protein n=1 Tax=Methyloceanibacter sp. TaxID=1965321 RepID=UPI003D6CBCAB
MMRPRAGQEIAPAGQTSAGEAPATTVVARKTQDQVTLEVAVSAPGRIDANGGNAIDFPIIIDATAALPARSVVAITALPEGASFSAGRPYGDNGWSLSPYELADLRLQLPAQTASANLRLELIAGDGTVLAHSATALSIAPPQVATVDDPLVDPKTFATGTAPQQIAQAEAIASVAPKQIAQAEAAVPVAEAPPPPPQRNPSSPAETGSAPTVNKVKVVSIAPPRETKPHDGAMALGSPADEPQGTGEWMVTKTAVDMHAKAEQSSETVKIAQGGLKVRVTARDKRWIQVTDPATSTTGWIYDRFLTPAEPPAQ